MLKRIIFTVTNDLNYDQRMQRICTSVAQAGFDVQLIGRKTKNSLPLANQLFNQKRLYCFFQKGILFYVEYNLRLFFFLLFQKTDVLCAIDLDTILPVYFVSFFRKKKRVYDAHELFTEQKEIVTRPFIHKCWRAIERFVVPKFSAGYTVNEFIAHELEKKYGVKYDIIRNLPIYIDLPEKKMIPTEKFFIYQGAVNEGRSFETLIPAMAKVDSQLRIYGQGNFMQQARQLIQEYQLEGKVILAGVALPADLKKITPQAFLGIMLFEQTGLNQYQSLSNRFFDYIMAGIPQLCVAYPAYQKINDEFHVAFMINDTATETIAHALNHILANHTLYETLERNCLEARKVLNWENEEKILKTFYIQLLQ